MSLEKHKENNEINVKNEINEKMNNEINEINEISEKMSNENNEENMYLKNSVDYSSYELPQSEGNGENGIPIDHDENDLNELAILGFFNDFALVDIGIHELIREIYFEE